MSILDNYYGEGKSIRDKIAELEEENETLKDNVEFLHSCLDDRDKSIVIMQEENKKLKSEIRRITNQRDNLKGIADNLVDENRYLEEENRKLKEELGKFIMKS